MMLTATVTSLIAQVGEAKAEEIKENLSDKAIREMGLTRAWIAALTEERVAMEARGVQGRTTAAKGVTASGASATQLPAASVQRPSPATQAAVARGAVATPPAPAASASFSDQQPVAAKAANLTLRQRLAAHIDAQLAKPDLLSP